MRFRKMRLALLRTKLATNGFYKGITFQNRVIKRKVKKVLAEWMFCLERYKEIRVESFKELFSELHEVVFPIKIEECYGRSLDIIFIDNEGKEYYMSKRCIYSYKEIENYIIGRRNSLLEPLVDRDFHYKISKDGTIILMETGAMKLKPDGKNDDTVVDFCYDSQKYTTEATLRFYASNNKMKMQYPTMGCEFDKKVLKFLFHINEKDYNFYDVFPVLKWIILTMPNEKVSLSITAEEEGDICSEVNITNGIVQRYTKTEIISEGEISISKLIFAKELEEFLSEKS